MIGKLSGRVDSMAGQTLVLDVGGVGYVLGCSSRTLAALPPIGQAVSLWVETQLREDAITLYGFADPAERDWFRQLQTVQGVGARVALAILSTLGPAALQQAIAAGDRAMLARADGVGPKLATRLVTELKDRVGAIATAAPPAAGAPPALSAGVADEAISALANLGYERGRAAAAVAAASAALGDDAALGVLLRRALQQLGQAA